MRSKDLDGSLCTAAPEKANGDVDGKRRMNDRIKGKKSEDPWLMLLHKE